MKKALYLFISLILLAFSACNQTNSDKNNTVDEEETAVSETEEKPALSARLDSLNKAHNESIIASGDRITKAYVLGDSSIWLRAEMRQDHRIFGYSKPDTTAEKLLLFSIFTNDVDDNPFGYELGAYYDTEGMDGLTLKYMSTTGDFIEAEAITENNEERTIYFEMKWIVFDMN